MKVQHSSYPPIDIPEGAWPVYKAQGYTKVVTPEMLAPEVEVKWSVHRGRFIGDYECPPFIAWSATNGNAGYTESAKGTAHKSVKVFIAGKHPVTCPPNIAEQYLRLWTEYAAKFKKKDKDGNPVPPRGEQVDFAQPPIPGVSPYSGATHQPWEYRGKE